MELQFGEVVHPCLDIPLREVQNLEQTQELKLPEGMPDIGRILASWGQPVLRSKEWNSDNISMTGGMIIWVLYAPEDGTQPRCLESWVPFQCRWNLPGETPEGHIRILCLNRFLDARTVSARKIMVRCAMAVMAEAFVPREIRSYTPENTPESVELLDRSYPVRLPREAGEKTFLLDEEIAFPASVPMAEKLLYYSVYPQVTDQKVLANKLVFRGAVTLHVLYVSEEGQLYSWDFELPFSQFAELEDSFSGDAQADIKILPTNMELEQMDEGQLRLKAGFVAQYVVDDREMLRLVQDAYSPGREIKLQLQDLKLPLILESRQENMYGEQLLPDEVNIAVDAQFLLDFPKQRRTEQGVQVEIPGTFQLLFYGPDGALQSAKFRWEKDYLVPADMDSQIAAVPQPVAVQMTPGGKTAVRVEFPVHMSATTSQGLPMVTALEVGQEKAKGAARPSLILQRTGEKDLWEIAKANDSTVAAIRQANQLHVDPLPGQMLLIPVH